jgi:hypothetical protein
MEKDRCVFCYEEKETKKFWFYARPKIEKELVTDYTSDYLSYCEDCGIPHFIPQAPEALNIYTQKARKIFNTADKRDIAAVLLLEIISKYNLPVNHLSTVEDKIRKAMEREI